MDENTAEVLAKARKAASDNLWFLHNPPTPMTTHLSVAAMHDLWPLHCAPLAAGKRRGAACRRPDTSVTLEGITVTVPGEDAVIADDDAIVVTARRIENPQRLFKKIIEYEKVRTKNPRLTSRILVTAVPVIAGIAYVVLKKPDQSPTILIGGLLSITGAIAYNSHYLGILLRRNELTNVLEKELGAQTHTQGKAIDHTITTIRQGYDEIVRQLTVRALLGEGCDPQRAETLATLAVQKSPRHATSLAPEHHKALHQSRPDLASAFIAQLFPEARQPDLEKLITIR